MQPGQCAVVLHWPSVERWMGRCSGAADRGPCLPPALREHLEEGAAPAMVVALPAERSHSEGKDLGGGPTEAEERDVACSGAVSASPECREQLTGSAEASVQRPGSSTGRDASPVSRCRGSRPGS
eukprot:11359885-Heterocapsa_arctica.AAC.1